MGVISQIFDNKIDLLIFRTPVGSDGKWMVFSMCTQKEELTDLVSLPFWRIQSK